jgi:hypothetical protein
MSKHPARALVRALQVSGAIAVLTAGFAIATGPAAAQGMITLEHAVKNCRLISDRAARLACYDGVIDEANGGPPRHQASMVPAPAAPAAKTAAPASQTAAKTSVPPPAAPAPARVAEAPAAPTAKSKSGGLFSFLSSRNGDATAKIAKVGQWEDGSLALTTKDGAVWVQSDLTDLNMVPRAGQTLTIAKTAFGDHVCQYGGSELFRCERKK